MNKIHVKKKIYKKNLKKRVLLSLVIIMTTCLPLASLVIDNGVGSEDISISTLHTSESASWNANGAVICPAPDDQWEPHIISDGAGGAIITWKDDRNSGTTGSDIYAQKINSAGIAQWETNGTLICNAAGDQLYPQLASDGAGGAIITWGDERVASNQDDIYAQRLNSAGAILWDDNGTLICNADYYQYGQQIISDGAGGAIIIWADLRDSSITFSDIYAQKINSAGFTQWNENGTVICNATLDQDGAKLVSDGGGGAIITWHDSRTSSTTGRDIYAQRITSAGNTFWSSNGTLICGEDNTQEYPQLVSDGNGGAIITWKDQRYGIEDIFAQKINSAGNMQWDTYWTLICNASGNQQNPQLVSDGNGGAIITWHDYRNTGTTSSDIYAQKINTIGIPQWDGNGSLICNAPEQQWSPQIISDGAGGAIITWVDLRHGAKDIYAQKIDSTGTTRWAENSTGLICNAIRDQFSPQIISDGNGGAIIAWQDEREALDQDDIYAQKIVDPSPGGSGGGIPGFDLVIISLISGIFVATLAKKHDKKKRLMREKF